MNTRTYVYIAAMALLAMAVTALAIAVSPLDDISARDLAGWAVFVGLGLLAERMAVTFTAGTKAAKSSVLFLPLFACAISFDPALLIIAVLIVVPFAEFVLLKPLAWRA